MVVMGLKETLLLRKEAFPLSGSSLEFGPLQIIDLVAKINSDSGVQLVEVQQGQHGPLNSDERHESTPRARRPNLTGLSGKVSPHLLLAHVCLN